MPRFNAWIKNTVTKVTTLAANDLIPLVSDDPNVSKAITKSNLATTVAADAAMTSVFLTQTTAADTYNEQGVLRLPGVAANYASCPNTAALQITGDIDVRVHVAADDWTPTTTNCLTAKSVDVANQISWRLELITSSGSKLRFRWSTTGDGAGGLTSVVSTASPSVADGAALWVRATLDVDNGAGGNDVKFYTSPDGSTWTQLGTTVTGGSTTSIFASTATQEVGARNAGAADPFAGKVFEVQVFDGIAGTLVYNPIFDHPITAWSAASPRRRDTTGRVTTINGDQWRWVGKV